MAIFFNRGVDLKTEKEKQFPFRSPLILIMVTLEWISVLVTPFTTVVKLFFKGYKKVLEQSKKFFEQSKNCF